jgi:16S rRNA A1518/A1519 N6-dimethyltransferase RsmA/KsgA/DIM1 with predicted DNA glycosylase/AP lyase activity
MKNPQTDELTTKLLTWQVSPRVPASFQREVWRRIAARQGEREYQAGYIQMMTARFIDPVLPPGPEFFESDD